MTQQQQYQPSPEEQDVMNSLKEFDQVRRQVQLTDEISQKFSALTRSLSMKLQTAEAKVADLEAQLAQMNSGSKEVTEAEVISHQ